MSCGRGKVLSGSTSSKECSFSTTEEKRHGRRTICQFIPMMENARQGNLSPGFSYGPSRLGALPSQECSFLSLQGRLIGCQSFTPQCKSLWLVLSSHYLLEVKGFNEGLKEEL